jgi:hypothetical protein
MPEVKDFQNERDTKRIAAEILPLAPSRGGHENGGPSRREQQPCPPLAKEVVFHRLHEQRVNTFIR